MTRRPSTHARIACEAGGGSRVLGRTSISGRAGATNGGRRASRTRPTQVTGGKVQEAKAGRRRADAIAVCLVAALVCREPRSSSATSSSTRATCSPTARRCRRRRRRRLDAARGRSRRSPRTARARSALLESATARRDRPHQSELDDPGRARREDVGDRRRVRADRTPAATTWCRCPSACRTCKRR